MTIDNELDDELAALLNEADPTGGIPHPAVSSTSPTRATAEPCRPLPRLPGVVHQFADDITPFTEADPFAVFMQALAAFGAIIGEGPFTLLDRPQPPLISPIIVGGTAKARKGTSWAPVKNLILRVEPDFASQIVNGFASGEALVDAVRDKDPDDDDDRVRDRRLLVPDEEYARHLKVCQRESSILSAVIRNAYDGERLENRSRGGGVVTATNPHISFIGHIVESELRRYMVSSEIAGGFANRHLFVSTKASKTLKRGVHISDDMFEFHADQVRRAVIFARSQRNIEWSPEADQLWDDDLRPKMMADDVPGMIGQLVARPEGNTARLAQLLALSDQSSIIDVPHLAGAWSIWQRCRGDVDRIFEGMSGNDALDKLIAALAAAPSGLDGVGAKTVLGGNNVKTVTDEGIDAGLIVKITTPSGGRGRPGVRYFHADHAPDHDPTGDSW